MLLVEWRTTDDMKRMILRRALENNATEKPCSKECLHQVRKATLTVNCFLRHAPATAWCEHFFPPNIAFPISQKIFRFLMKSCHLLLEHHPIDEQTHTFRCVIQHNLHRGFCYPGVRMFNVCHLSSSHLAYKSKG